MSMSNVTSMIDGHEGFRSKPYMDCCGKFFRLCTCLKKGKLSIGKGTNIEDGITEEEANLLRTNRISKTIAELSKFPWFKSLNLPRQDATIDMAYNLGLPKLLEFKNMLAALSAQNYGKAADEMLNSDWATQVGERAKDLAHIMRLGIYN